MGGVFCSTQCPGVISIALALGASLIRPRFVCGGAAGVATGLQRHCLIATAGVVYRLRLPSAENGPFYKELCEPIHVLKPLPMSRVPNLLAG